MIPSLLYLGSLERPVANEAHAGEFEQNIIDSNERRDGVPGRNCAFCVKSASEEKMGKDERAICGMS